MPKNNDENGKTIQTTGVMILPTQAMHYLGKIMWIVWSSLKIGNWTIPVQIQIYEITNPFQKAGTQYYATTFLIDGAESITTYVHVIHVRMQHEV